MVCQAAEQVSKNVLRVLTLCLRYILLCQHMHQQRPLLHSNRCHQARLLQRRQDVPVYTGENTCLNGQQQPIPKV